jgi:hypothetical protein
MKISRTRRTRSSAVHSLVSVASVITLRISPSRFRFSLIDRAAGVGGGTMGRSCDVRAILAFAFAFAFACVGATADGQKGVSITLTTEWTVRLVRRSRHRRASEGAARSLSPIAPEDRSAPRLSD